MFLLVIFFKTKDYNKYKIMFYLFDIDLFNLIKTDNNNIIYDLYQKIDDNYIKAIGEQILKLYFDKFF